VQRGNRDQVSKGSPREGRCDLRECVQAYQYCEGGSGDTGIRGRSVEDVSERGERELV
jgi:hypothetical protein